jgi:hypothetical protein
MRTSSLINTCASQLRRTVKIVLIGASRHSSRTSDVSSKPTQRPTDCLRRPFPRFRKEIRCIRDLPPSAKGRDCSRGSLPAGLNSGGSAWAKRPFAGPEQVLTYISRYTHRVAISNSRLISLDDNGVTFDDLIVRIYALVYRHAERGEQLTASTDRRCPLRPPVALPSERINSRVPQRADELRRRTIFGSIVPQNEPAPAGARCARAKRPGLPSA